MKATELFNAIGDDNIKIQNLDQCAKSLSSSVKNGTTISFGTDMPLVPFRGTKEMGFIVWVPRDVVAKVMAEKDKKEV